MEIRNIHTEASWLASYSDQQTEALIKCQMDKITQLLGIIEIIKGEIELTESPQEVSHKTIVESIKGIVNTIQKVSHSIGYFRWEE